MRHDVQGASGSALDAIDRGYPSAERRERYGAKNPKYLIRRHCKPTHPRRMTADTLTCAPQANVACGLFAASPDTITALNLATAGDAGAVVCALGSRGQQELVGMLATERQMTRVALLQHLTRPRRPRRQ